MGEFYLQHLSFIHLMNAADGVDRKDEAGCDASLVRLVDASELEATVVRNAEKRARDATIPRFRASRGLGFGTRTLGQFCSDADPLVLRMAADAARREGRKLRESGVTNLAARDRVRLRMTLFCFFFPLLTYEPTSPQRCCAWRLS